MEGQNKKILFLSKGSHSPSTRYRALSYFPLLEQEKWIPSHISFTSHPLKKLSILKLAKNSQAVVVLRKGLPYFFLKLLRKVSPYLIFDFDDAVYLHNNESPSSKRQARFSRMIQSSDAIWAGNRHLLKMALPYNSVVEILPTSLHPLEYDLKVKPPKNTLDLVWIGSSSTRKYIQEIIPMLEEFVSFFPHLRLKIISDFAISSKRLKIISIPWDLKTEKFHLKTSHIGIAPLPKDEWTKGKCGLKILQYMVSSLPVIASPVGVQIEMVEPSRGILVQTFREWRLAIEKLLCEKTRKKIGQEGKTWVIKNYSLDKTFQKMKNALSKIEKY